MTYDTFVCIIIYTWQFSLPRTHTLHTAYSTQACSSQYSAFRTIEYSGMWLHWKWWRQCDKDTKLTMTTENIMLAKWCRTFQRQRHQLIMLHCVSLLLVTVCTMHELLKREQFKMIIMMHFVFEWVVIPSRMGHEAWRMKNHLNDGSKDGNSTFNLPNVIFRQQHTQSN